MDSRVLRLIAVGTISASLYLIREYMGGNGVDEAPMKPEEEIDDRIIDDVQVSFYTRPVDMSSSASTYSNNNDPSSDEKLRHWALVFYFPNSGRFIMHEANDVDGKLVWLCRQMIPSIKGYKLYDNIATCKTSPKQLHEWAKGIPINNLPYNCTLRNCQEWIKLFAQKIGGEVCKYVEEQFKSFYDEDPVTAYAAGVCHAVYQGTVGKMKGDKEKKKDN